MMPIKRGIKGIGNWSKEEREKLWYLVQVPSPKKVSHIKNFDLFFVPNNGKHSSAENKKRFYCCVSKNNPFCEFTLKAQLIIHGAPKSSYKQYLTSCTSPVLNILAHLVGCLLCTLWVFFSCKRSAEFICLWKAASCYFKKQNPKRAQNKTSSPKRL